MRFDPPSRAPRPGQAACGLWGKALGGRWERWVWLTTALWPLASVWQPAHADDALAQRRARVAAMTAAEREQLARRYERFMALSPEERDRLRALHRALEEDPAVDELRAVMMRYHRWLSRLSTAQRAELLAMRPDERLEKIRQLRAEERARQRRHLSLEDRQAVVRWIEGLVRGRLSPEEWERLQALPEQQRRAELARLVMQRRAQSVRLATAAEENLKVLREALSPRAREALDAEATPEGRRVLVGIWLRQAFADVYPRGPFRRWEPPEPEALMRFMNEELSPQERQELTGLSEEELLRRLQRLYFQRQLQRNPQNKGSRRGPPWERKRPEAQRERGPQGRPE